MDHNQRKPSGRGFRIYKQEPYADTLRRLILEQLSQSLEFCKQPGKDPDTAIHEIRKCTKRIRAVYRLCRTAAGEETFRLAMKKYSEISQVFANPRLSAVYLETLGMLADDKRIPVAPSYLSEQMKEFQQKHKRLITQEIHKQKILSKTKTLLLGEITGLPGIFVDKVDFQVLAEGLRKTYGRGKTYLEIANQQPLTENLHNLRKSVKYLWNQYIILRPIWPPVIGTTIHQLDLLAEKLGNEHDLAELEQYLRNEKTGKNSAQHELLLNYIAGKRKQLQQAINPLAMRIYAEKQAAVVKRLKTYERIYRKTIFYSPNPHSKYEFP